MEISTLPELFKSTFPFWEAMRDEDKNMFLRSAQNAVFKKGTTVHDGNECTGVILIKTGALRMYLLSDDGKEVTLCRLFPGDTCIFTASCALDSITFDVSVDAEEDSECVIIGGCAYEEVVRKLPEAKIYTYEAALSRFSDVMWAMQQILFMSMDKRLAIFLLDESANSGSDTVKLTHEQIAKYMGSAREVVTRMLKYFSSEGIVELSRGGIKITDIKKLRNMAI